MKFFEIDMILNIIGWTNEEEDDQQTQNIQIQLIHKYVYDEWSIFMNCDDETGT